MDLVATKRQEAFQTERRGYRVLAVGERFSLTDKRRANRLVRLGFARLAESDPEPAPVVVSAPTVEAPKLDKRSRAYRLLHGRSA